MKLSFKQIEPFLKNPPADIPVVLLYGPDEGQVRERGDLLARQVAGDIKDPFLVAEVGAEQLRATPSLLTDEAQALSMLGGRRVVRVRATSFEGEALRQLEAAVDSLLAAITPADNFVVIEAGNLGPSSKLRKACEAAAMAAALPCYVEEERDLSRVIAAALKDAGYAIDNDALATMAAHVIGDRAVVRSEIEKLITYMGPENRRVALEDVIACIGDVADLTLDRLTNAAAGGDAAAAERVLSSLSENGTPFVIVTRSLQNHFLRLHATRLRLDAGEDAENALKKLRPAVFWKVKNAFLGQLRAWTAQDIEDALRLITLAEFQCKQTGSLPDLILSRLVLSLCQRAGRSARRQAS